MIILCLLMHTITVDGEPSDWIGVLPSQIHTVNISAGEWIYRGDINDRRTDYPMTDDNDIVEVRVTGDATYIYFLIKMKDIRVIDSVHVGIAVNCQDIWRTWNRLGDDAETNISAQGLGANATRIICFHCPVSNSPDIEMWDGGVWYAPPSSDYQIVIDAANDVVEAKINWSDLEVTLPEEMWFWCASFQNRVGWCNDVEAVVDINNTSDAVDCIGGETGSLKIGVSKNAWNRDIHDGTLDGYYHIIFNSNGDVKGAIKQVDGINDWIGKKPSQIHAITFSQREFIYKGEAGDCRTDPPFPSFCDLTELRLSADDQYLYIFVKLKEISIDTFNVCLSIDKDFTSSDTALNWNGCWSNTFLGDTKQFAERNLMMLGTGAGSYQLYLYADDGTQWYIPPADTGPRSYLIKINPRDTLVEAKVTLEDLALSITDTITISFATYDNRPGDPNTQDVTANYSVCDAIDCIGGQKGISANAWDRDLSDGYLNYYFRIPLCRLLADTEAGIDTMWISPESVAINTTCTTFVIIRNYGRYNASGINVEQFINDNLNGFVSNLSLEVDQDTTLKFLYTPTIVDTGICRDSVIVNFTDGYSKNNTKILTFKVYVPPVVVKIKNKQNLAPSTALQDTFISALRLSLSANRDSTFLIKIKLKTFGNYELSDIDSIKVFTNTTVLAETSFCSQTQWIELTPCKIDTSLTDIYIGYKLAKYAKPGRFFNVAIESTSFFVFIYPGELADTNLPAISDTCIIEDKPDVCIVKGKSIAPDSAGKGEKKVPFIELEIYTPEDFALLDSIKVEPVIASSADIESIFVFKDNGDKIFDLLEDVLIGKELFSSSPQIINIPEDTLRDTVTYFIALNISSNATSNQIALSIPTKNYITLVSPDTILDSNFPIHSDTAKIVSPDTVFAKFEDIMPDEILQKKKTSSILIKMFTQSYMGTAVIKGMKVKRYGNYIDSIYLYKNTSLLAKENFVDTIVNLNFIDTIKPAPDTQIYEIQIKLNPLAKIGDSISIGFENNLFFNISSPDEMSSSNLPFKTKFAKIVDFSDTLKIYLSPEPSCTIVQGQQEVKTIRCSLVVSEDEIILDSVKMKIEGNAILKTIKIISPYEILAVDTSPDSFASFIIKDTLSQGELYKADIIFDVAENCPPNTKVRFLINHNLIFVKEPDVVEEFAETTDYWIIKDLPDTLFIYAKDIALDTAIAGTQDFPLLELKAKIKGDAIIFRGIKFHLLGDLEEGCVKLKLYKDTILLQQTNFTEGIAQFVFEETLKDSQVYYVKANFDSIITGNSFGIETQSKDDFVLSQPDVIDSASSLISSRIIFVGILERKIERTMLKKIYPNPAFGLINLAFVTNGKNKVKIKVYDCAGRLVYNYSNNLKAGEHLLKLKFAHAGIYFVVFESGNYNKKDKIVILKGR